MTPGSGSGRDTPRLYRVILPVRDVEQAATFYEAALDARGERVSPGRHYIACGAVILALYDPRADGDDFDPRPNQEHVYFAVADLEGAMNRVRAAGPRRIDDRIETMPWGERSFYCVDPFGNPLCFVDERTVFTGGLSEV